MRRNLQGKGPLKMPNFIAFVDQDLSFFIKFLKSESHQQK